MKINLKFLLVFTVLLIFQLFQSSALAWNTYSDLAVELTKNTYILLVKHQVCEDINKCRAQERVFRGGSPDRANVSVYKTNDLSWAAIQDIIKLCLDAYVLHGGKQTITLQFFRETIRERNARFSGIKPFIHLQLKGEK